MDLEQRIKEIYDDFILTNSRKTDRLFGIFLAVQWIIGIALCLYLGKTNEQLQFAILGGAVLTLIPGILVLRIAGNSINSYVITIAQTLFTFLFVYLNDGRIEAHFHIFGSLAFLAFYRNWKLLVFSTFIASFILISESRDAPQKALEHIAWILFADVFLLYSIGEGLRTLKMVSQNQASLLKTIVQIQKVQKEVTEHQQALVAASKMSSLGEMAGGVAHEINNPLAIIIGISNIIEDMIQQDELDKVKLNTHISKIIKTSERIAKIVHGLRTFSRDGSHDKSVKVNVNSMINETLSFCKERFTHHGIKLNVNPIPADLCFMGQETQISQVLLNLLNNAHDAVEKTPGSWVDISVNTDEKFLEIRVTDSGNGISTEVKNKLFQPFFYHQRCR